MAFELSVESRMAEAIVLMLAADATLSAYCTGGIKHHTPESDDAFISAPKIMVWPVPPSDDFRRTPGDFLQPGFHIGIVLVEPQNDEPIQPNTISPIDRLAHIEKVLNLGSELDGKGSLVDPYAAVGASGNLKYLNDGRPSFRRRSPKLIVAAAAQAWPIEAYYPTTLQGSTRQR